MTREEKIRQLENLKSHCGEMAESGNIIWKKDVAALEEAIAVLSADPCGDTISRAQALEHIQHRLYETALNVNGKKGTDDIRDIYEDIAERQIVTWIKEIKPTCKLPASEQQVKTEMEKVIDEIVDCEDADGTIDSAKLIERIRNLQAKNEKLEKELAEL